MTEAVIKDRPAQLVRRAPRPAPDEKVDPVDYLPAAVAPVVTPVAAPAPLTRGVEETADAPMPIQKTAPEPTAAKPAAQEAQAAPAKQPTRSSKSAKAAPNKKASRREVTFPLSTRISQEVMDILYTAVEEEGITVREAIEMGIKHRWG